jgi:hypothetical protein
MSACMYVYVSVSIYVYLCMYVFDTHVQNASHLYVGLLQLCGLFGLLYVGMYVYVSISMYVCICVYLIRICTAHCTYCHSHNN